MKLSIGLSRTSLHPRVIQMLILVLASKSRRLLVKAMRKNLNSVAEITSTKTILKNLETMDSWRSKNNLQIKILKMQSSLLEGPIQVRTINPSRRNESDIHHLQRNLPTIRTSKAIALTMMMMKKPQWHSQRNEFHQEEHKTKGHQ